MNREYNRYELADIKGRELFKEFCNTQTWCTMIKEAPLDKVWDVAYYSGGTKVVGEIKVRTYNSTAFADWDYEQTKHDNLLTVYEQTKNKERNKNKQVEIQYINFFKDDAVKIWTTTNIHNEQQPIYINRQKSDVEDKGDKMKWIYGCKLNNEAFRGTRTPLIFNIVQDDNENDGLPF